MSRNWMPGAGKSGTVRTSALMSSGLNRAAPPMRSARRSSRLALRPLLHVEPSRLGIRPHLLLGEEGEDCSEDQEAEHDETRLMAFAERGLSGPDEERGHVLGHLVDRRVGTV